MIPKKIHFLWFGKKDKSELIERCISSWKNLNPDFEIKEWNEQNFDVNSHPFTKKMYASGHYAFVSDYARLEIIEKEGGVYLDTDMLLVKSLSDLLDTECFLGKESENIISAGAFGAIPNHPFISACRSYYDLYNDERITIPRVLTSVYENYGAKETLEVYPPETFYPFDAENIKKYKGQNLDEKTYGVHLWNFSWGTPSQKFFKKMGIYSMGKRLVEILGIKRILKKILGYV